MAIALIQDYVFVSCCMCGVSFAVPLEMNNRLRQTHNWFYCPNGHQQQYTGKTEAEKLKEQLQASERMRIAEAAAAEAALREQKRKLAARINRGVCPHCNRKFSELARHMETKHKKCLGPQVEPKRLTA